jgi:hypothetical protein
MAKKNEDNMEEYLKKMNKDLIPAPVSKEKFSEHNCITEALKEGNRLLAEEEKSKGKSSPKQDDKKKLDTALSTSSKNPYVQARIQVLNGWKKDPHTAWRVNEIESMENGTIPKDYHYDEFVRAVADLGDTLSNQK